MAHHGRAALWAFGRRSITAGVVVHVELCNCNSFVAVLADNLLVHTSNLGQRVATHNLLCTVWVGALNKCEFAPALDMSLQVLAGTLVTATLIRAFDSKAV